MTRSGTFPRLLVVTAWVAIACTILFAVWAVGWPLYLEYKAIEYCKVLRQDSSKEAWERSSQQLQKLGSRAVPHLIELLKDRSCDNRWRAAFCLEQIGPGAVAAVPDLIDAIEDPQLSTRVGACRALGAIGSREAVPGVLRAAHGDRTLNVRGEALKALERLNGDAVANAEGVVFMNRGASELEDIRRAWEDMAAERHLGSETKCTECHQKRSRS